MQGFYARPVKKADGTLNLLEWDVGIPGKPDVSLLVGGDARAMLAGSSALTSADHRTCQDALGWRNVHTEDGVSRRISCQTSEM